MENNIERGFRPTVEWMAEKYAELNEKYFNNELGPCNFGIFTTGKGSRGSVLGWFKITGFRIKVSRTTRRMYQASTDNVYINRENFVSLCAPKIELNGNYSGTEFGFTCTLIHEMCHYYNYMDGYCPKQGHGREFREIAALVNMRSGGIYSVQRIASAEQMKEFDLDNKYKEMKARRQQNKNSNTKVVFIFMLDGEIRMVRTTNPDVVRAIVDIEARRKRAYRIGMIADPAFNEFISKKGYTSNATKYRYWDVRKADWLPEILNYKQDNLWTNPDVEDKEEEVEKNTTPIETKPQTPAPPTQMFTLKTKNGDWQVPFNGDYDELVTKVRERFPNLPDHLIDKIIHNTGNFKKIMKEEKSYIEKIVEGVVRELKNQDDIPITPDMNLGEFSPLEL